MADEDWDNRSEVSYESEISGITKSTLTTEDASEVSYIHQLIFIYFIIKNQLYIYIYHYNVVSDNFFYKILIKTSFFYYKYNYM